MRRSPEGQSATEVRRAAIAKVVRAHRNKLRGMELDGLRTVIADLHVLALGAEEYLIAPRRRTVRHNQLPMYVVRRLVRYAWRDEYAVFVCVYELAFRLRGAFASRRQADATHPNIDFVLLLAAFEEIRGDPDIAWRGL